MNARAAARWLTWSRRRLVACLSAVAVVSVVAVAVVLAARVTAVQDAVAGVAARSTTSAPSASPTVTATQRDITGPATTVVRAWLAGDATLGGAAHPDLVDALAARSGASVALLGSATVDQVLGATAVVSFPTVGGGRLVVTMFRTDEAGWVAKELTGP